jgi:hypothetical protein
MRTVFQVVATMVVANAAVAYGADAKGAAAKIKAGAAATAADAKAKASDVATGAKAQAAETKATVKEAAAEATKKAEAQPAPAAEPATTPITEAKEMAKEAVASQAGNTSELAGTPKSLIIPESAVLPESVLRFRAVYATAESEKGYDGAGNKVQNGIEVKVNAATAVFEYGITDKISAQVLVPYRMNGEAKVDSNENFAKVGLLELLDDKIEEITHAVSTGALSAAYANNVAAPQDIQLVSAFAGTPFASFTTIPKGDPVKTGLQKIAAQLRAVARNPSASPQAAAAAAALLNFAKTEVGNQKFQKGIGDVEVGAKYALSTVNEPWFDGIPFYTSVAAGMRFNTSKYTEATKKGEKPVGRGTMDGAIRLNADYEVINGVQLQLENQSELALAKGKAWNYSEANKGKELDLERKGLRQVGYTKLVLAPGTWVPAVDFLMLNARYGWNNESTTKLGDVETAGSVGRSAQLGVSFDGLKLKLPVQLDYDHVLAARGRGVESAFDANVVTLKLFYKF